MLTLKDVSRKEFLSWERARRTLEHLSLQKQPVLQSTTQQETLEFTWSLEREVISLGPVLPLAPLHQAQVLQESLSKIWSHGDPPLQRNLGNVVVYFEISGTEKQHLIPTLKECLYLVFWLAASDLSLSLNRLSLFPA